VTRTGFVSTERIGGGLSVVIATVESSSASSVKVLELLLASWTFSEGLEFNVYEKSFKLHNSFERASKNKPLLETVPK
jgi:hypothetical protein